MSRLRPRDLKYLAQGQINTSLVRSCFMSLTQCTVPLLKVGERGEMFWVIAIFSRLNNASLFKDRHLLGHITMLLINLNTKVYKKRITSDSQNGKCPEIQRIMIKTSWALWEFTWQATGFWWQWLEGREQHYEGIFVFLTDCVVHNFHLGLEKKWIQDK